MSSSSSTSSSEIRWRVGLLEHACPVRVPWTFLTACTIVLIIESLLWDHRVWFSDRAAWQWQVKREQLAEADFSGDVAVLGSSITFHSVDPRWIAAQDPKAPAVVNLALNGLSPAHYPSVVRDYLRHHRPPAVLIVEVRSAEVADVNWLAGPWWRFWGSWGDYVRSGLPFRNPGTVCDFAAHRLWASYSYGPAIDNLLTASLKERTLSITTRDRNLRVAQEMRSSRGFSTSDFYQPLTTDRTFPPQGRPWQENYQGVTAFDEIAQLCGTHGMQLVLYRAPAPPFAEAERLQSRFDEGFAAFIKGLRARWPEASISVFAPTGYALEDFTDDHHFSPRGARRLMNDLRSRLTSEI